MSAVTVYVPIDSAARSVGADQVAAAIANEAAKRNLDVKLVRNGTRGLLWLEPMVEVATAAGRVAYGPVTPDDVASLFDAGFLTGGTHDLSHGLTDDIPWLKNQDRLTFVRLGVTDPLDPDDYVAHGGLVGLERALTLTPEAIIGDVAEAGLRGRGGAASATGAKWKAARAAHADQKYICCNADEGDSGTFADRMVMEDDPFMLIEGMVIAGIAVGATQGYIYLRSEYPQALEHLTQAIAIAYERHWLGDTILGSSHQFHLEIRVGAGSYVCGEQTAMIESLEGKRGNVRAQPPALTLHGLWQMPTVVNNVLTLATVPVILAKGGEFYQNYGVGKSLGTQSYQLAGNIKQGGLVEKAFGISLHDLIYDFGGGTHSGRPVRAVQVGGPLGSYVPVDLLHTSADYESMDAIQGIMGHGGIVVFDDTVNMAKQARFAMEFCEIESCGKCTPCRIGSVRGVEFIDDILDGKDAALKLELLEEVCSVMTDASLCGMGRSTPLPVVSAMTHFPEDFHTPTPQARQVA